MIRIKLSSLIENYFSIVFMSINPLLGFVASFRGLGRNNLISIMNSVILLSIMAYIMKPYVGWDIVRYYDYYNSNENHTFNIIDIFFNIGTVSIFIDTLSHYGIKKEFIPAISTFLQYTGIFLALYKTILKYKSISKSKVYFFYITVFLSSSFIASASGVRNGAALGLFTLGYYYWTESNKLRMSFFFLIASCIHFYVLLPILLILLNNILYFIKEKTYRLLLITIIPISILGLGNLIISSLFVALKPILSSINLYKTDYVISGQYSSLNISDIYDLFLRLIVLMPLIYMAVILLYNSKFKGVNFKERNLVYQLLIISFLFSSMVTLFNRYSVLTEVLCMIYFCKVNCYFKERFKGISYKDLLLLLFLSLACIKPLGQYRGIYVPSWSPLFSQFTYGLMQSSVTPEDYIPAETSSIRTL